MLRYKGINFLIFGKLWRDSLDGLAHLMVEYVSSFTIVNIGKKLRIGLKLSLLLLLNKKERARFLRLLVFLI